MSGQNKANNAFTCYTRVALAALYTASDGLHPLPFSTSYCTPNADIGATQRARIVPPDQWRAIDEIGSGGAPLTMLVLYPCVENWNIFWLYNTKPFSHILKLVEYAR